MGKTSSKVKDKYNAKAYDRLAIRVKKGKANKIKEYAASQGLSLNGYVNKLIDEDMSENKA